jgi:hypothetical protein
VVATALAAGGDTTCIITSAGKQLCIGDNSYYQMGVWAPPPPTSTRPRCRRCPRPATPCRSAPRRRRRS